MNELLIGIAGSIIATIIVSFFSRGRWQDDAAPTHFRWFWRLLFLAGKLSFFYGMFVVAINLALNTPATANNIAVGSMFFGLGLVAWLLGYLFR